MWLQGFELRSPGWHFACHGLWGFVSGDRQELAAATEKTHREAAGGFEVFPGVLLSSCICHLLISGVSALFKILRLVPPPLFFKCRLTELGF